MVIFKGLNNWVRKKVMGNVTQGGKQKIKRKDNLLVDRFYFSYIKLATTVGKKTRGGL